MSDDGNRLIVGANGWNHILYPQNIQQHVYVYDWDGRQWADNYGDTIVADGVVSTGYGTSVDVSADGNRWVTGNPLVRAIGGIFHQRI